MKPSGLELGPWGFIQAFVLGGGLVAFWLMPQWQWDGEVHVKGLHYLSAQLITRSAGLPSSGSLYQLNPSEIRERLLKIEAIQDAKVRRWLFPPRLDIEIQERFPKVRVLGAVTPTYMDTQGILFTLPVSARPSTPLSVKVGTGSLSTSDSAALRSLLEVWPKESSGTLDLRDAASWSAVVDGVRVDLGRADRLGEKLRLYSHLLPLAREAGKAVQYIDLRFPEAPTIRASEATHQP